MRVDATAAFSVLRLSTRLVESVQAAMREAGFVDLRPAHGFAFVRLSQGSASTVELAAHLGMTKQSASQLVEQLVEGGYVSREPDESDGRVRRLTLTDRGRAATRVAEGAASDVLAGWRDRLGPTCYRGWDAALTALADGGPIRPHG